MAEKNRTEDYESKSCRPTLAARVSAIIAQRLWGNVDVKEAAVVGSAAAASERRPSDDLAALAT
jgi:hypothetical protein